MSQKTIPDIKVGTLPLPQYYVTPILAQSQPSPKSSCPLPAIRAPVTPVWQTPLHFCDCLLTFRNFRSGVITGVQHRAETRWERRCGTRTAPRWTVRETARRRPSVSCLAEVRGNGGRRGGAREGRRRRETRRARAPGRRHAGRAARVEEAALAARAAKAAAAPSSPSMTYRRSGSWPTYVNDSGRSPSTRLLRRYVRSFPPYRRTS